MLYIRRLALMLNKFKLKHFKLTKADDVYIRFTLLSDDAKFPVVINSKYSTLNDLLYDCDLLIARLSGDNTKKESKHGDSRKTFRDMFLQEHTSKQAISELTTRLSKIKKCIYDGDNNLPLKVKAMAYPLAIEYSALIDTLETVDESIHTERSTGTRGDTRS